ncbi:uroporphyrinogen-III synthase [Fluviicola taffensis]|uniref:uroporphyrinogen-III synthase n=1 Tax=Fluviicola taffensis TaxID=191579 RepID=UPI003137D9CF
MKIKSIFLSSDTDSSLPILDFCNENQIRLVRKSFISFQQIPFKVPNKWDVVFFSSPRSFDFFVSESFTLGSHQQIACIGIETKNHIELNGYPVSFFGENAGKPAEIASHFKTWLGNRIALFPQSSKSNKSIESAIPESQRISLLVYKTIDHPIVLGEVFSVLVFTSPSNYKSFVSLNAISKESIVVAWGATTAQSIKNDGIEVDLVLQTSTYSELLQILQKVNK